jgi:phage-related baseplate assembly protein
VICPQNDPSDAWVVNEQEVAAETRQRLAQTLEALREAGIEATGRVVDRDPYTAVLDVVESADPPSEIVISTLPQTRSGWLRRDLVERLRDRTGLPIQHIVVDVEPGRASRT